MSALKELIIFTSIFLVGSLLGEFVLELRTPVYLMVYGWWLGCIAAWTAETTVKLPSHQ